jgi:hypothetical protein
MRWEQIYNLPVYNNSGETIPSYAITQISNWQDGVLDDEFFSCSKPNGSGKSFIINSDRAIAVPGPDNSGTGRGTQSPGVYVRYSGTTPVAGQEWGPVASNWAITAAGTGYLIIGDVTTIGGVDVVRVSPIQATDAALAIGIFIDTVPAASIAVGGSDPSYTLTFTHGYTADSVLLLRLKENRTGWEFELDDSDEPKKVGGVNFSFSRLRASQTDPITQLGFVKTLSIEDVDTEVFIPANWDMSSLLGFDQNSDPSQVPYHLYATSEFRLNARPCEEAP